MTFFKVRIALAAVSLSALAACTQLDPSQVIVRSTGSAPAPVVAVEPVAAANAASAAAYSSGPGLTIVGQGVARGEPDLAYVTAGVQTRAATAREAQEENNRVMQQVVGRIKALAIGEGDVRTNAVALFPVNEPPDGRLAGYQANNSVEVTLRDPRRVADVLEAALAAGANQAGDVRFAFRDDAPLRRQALDQALRSARGDAEAIAQTAGLRLGALQSVAVEPAGAPIAAEGAPPHLPAAQGPPVQPGQLAVVARVRMVYQLQ
jgi:uncharacterized protein YggE